MGRHAQPIEGAVSRVSDVQDCGNGYRVRFYLNGVLTEKNRATKKDAEALRKSLVIRAETEGTGPAQTVQATSLSAARLRAAELAFAVLEAKGYVSGDTQAMRLVTAVTFYVEAAGKMEKGVSMAEAYEKFLDSRKGRIAASTTEDYKRHVAPFVEKFKDMRVGEITTLDCKAWVESFNGGTNQFRCYGYLAAFFEFCAGKHNPFSNGHPWIQISPVRGFAKPGYSVGDVQSYNFAEIVALLKRAQKKRVLPYFIFRLFSMLRTDEMGRLLAKGVTVQKIDFINTRDGVIQLPPDVSAQKGKSRNKPRALAIHPTFRVWLRRFSQDKLSLACYHQDEAKVRAAVRGKTGGNLLRHTAITMRLKATGDIVTTAREAGNTPAMITGHYLNLNVDKADADKLYALTPDKAKELGIL